MILSSADIVRLIGADAIIRQAAKISVVEGRPGLGTEDTVYIYIDKFPSIEEFEATWKIWVVDNSGMGEFVLNALTSILPSFDFAGDHYTTTDFASDRTVIKTEAEKQLEQLQAERLERQEDFKGLQKGLEARLSTVRDGLDGRDGKDGLQGPAGPAGEPGRPGRDLDATETELFDLKDVEQSILPLQKGQVLTWNGQEWTNLYIPTISSFISGGSGGGGGGTGDGELVIISDEAPTKRDDGTPLQDGDQWWSSSVGRMHIYYVDEDSSQWVQSSADGNSGGGSGGPGGQGGIPEAPTDGSAYLRKDADWVDSFDLGIEVVASKSFTYDNDGNLTGVTDAEVSKTMTYDTQGRLETLVATKGSKTITKNFQYTPDGNLNQIIVS